MNRTICTMAVVVMLAASGCVTMQGKTPPGKVLSVRGDTLFAYDAELRSVSSDKTGIIPAIMKIVAGGCPETSLNRPTDIDVDSDGKIYVCDGNLGRVVRYDGYDCSLTGVSIFGEDILSYPVGVEATDTRIFVTDSRFKEVQIYNKMLIKVGKLSAPGGWERPGQMHWDGERLFVCDTGRQLIQVFDNENKWIQALGDTNISKEKFVFPMAVCNDSKGQTWVLDALNHRVLAYDKDLNFLHGFGVQDQAPGGLMFPKGLAIDQDDNIYVSDAYFSRIQVFAESGALLYWFGSTGSEQDDFLMPGAICIENDKLLVADQLNQRVNIVTCFSEYEGGASE
jgi:sugar lactone lactonase YvrE